MGRLSIAIAAAGLILAGCETAPILSLDEQIRNASNAEVCEAVIFGPPHVASRAHEDEVGRGINCVDYQQAAAALYQQRLASQQRPDNTAAVLRGIGQALRQQPQAPVTCTSQRLGSSVYTSCN